jgi:hypothetical protein
MVLVPSRTDLPAECPDLPGGIVSVPFLPADAARESKKRSLGASPEDDRDAAPVRDKVVDSIVHGFIDGQGWRKCPRRKPRGGC